MSGLRGPGPRLARALKRQMSSTPGELVSRAEIAHWEQLSRARGHADFGEFGPAHCAASPVHVAFACDSDGENRNGSSLAANAARMHHRLDSCHVDANGVVLALLANGFDGCFSTCWPIGSRLVLDLFVDAWTTSSGCTQSRLAASFRPSREQFATAVPHLVAEEHIDIGPPCATIGASRNYPALRTLAPARPPHAKACPHCEEFRVSPSSAEGCPMCLYPGWVPPNPPPWFLRSDHGTGRRCRDRVLVTVSGCS